MSRQRPMISAIGLPLAAALLLGACATTSVRTDYDQRTDFARYQTYAIQSGPLVREDDVSVVPDARVRDRIHGAIERELAAKGVEPARHERPDILVTYAVTAMRQPELVETVSEDPSRNYASHGIFPREVDRGTLVIDVIETDAGRLVWRSIAKAENEDVQSAQFIWRAVDKAMEQFPPETASCASRSRNTQRNDTCDE
jgi:hypothetical protein